MPTSKVVDLVHNALHINMSDIEKELESHNGRAVRLSWLKDHLAEKTCKMPLQDIECAVRGYLLYLLGCTIFSDKTGALVAVEYLQYFEDLENVKNYAWGAATLVHLYRQLGIASRAKCRQISGYLTLIQAWVYEHIPLLRPAQDERASDRSPRAALWKNSRNLAGLQKNSVVVIRELLDSLSPEQIDFDPYHNIRDWSSMQEYVFYKGCLVANRVFEPYMPDRMLRQLGHIQTIPLDPTRPDQRTRRPRAASGYKVSYGGNVEHMEQWENGLLGPKTRGSQVQRPWDTVPEYMGWFERVSHRFVQNPDKRRFLAMRASSAQMTISSDEEWVDAREIAGDGDCNGSQTSVAGDVANRREEKGRAREREGAKGDFGGPFQTAWTSGLLYFIVHTLKILFGSQALKTVVTESSCTDHGKRCAADGVNDVRYRATKRRIEASGGEGRRQLGKPPASNAL
ncbi:hypothetical protein QJS04_geneDACA017288 [Acorus gramineus]|uniref:Aminotransferase-like plant mobile domain-containing protein n=1 Tax=Acorus gramineus TaxID=55184 RepID=A0AAV9A2W3_ACOGR|nr:hypothetical protein QJS04_geneDACA017288 [Acorus gramineus]